MHLDLLGNSCIFTYCLIATLFLPSKAEWNTKDFMKREHSLIKPYQATGTTIPYWDIQGNTIVTTNYVRLTPDSQSKRGAVWNAVPCKVHNWELQIHFKVHGSGKDLYGDGLAIWYAQKRMVSGPVFGNMDYFQGLAIILDTYSNHNGPHQHQHPYISGMINNGTLHYDHDRDGTHTQIAGCEAKFRNVDYDTHIAIRYEKDTLTVSTDFENKAAWKVCFQSKGIILPTGYYFGVTAATGDLSDNHDLMSIRLFELDDPQDGKVFEDRSNILPSAVFFEPPRERAEDPKSSSWNGIKLFMIMMLASISLIAVVVVGIMYYQKQQENSRKRFY